MEMAVLKTTSDGRSVPPEVAQSLEVDDDYNKLPGRNVFRTKKFTKKRHESKSRKTDSLDSSNVCYSDEDYPQTSSSARTVVEPPPKHSIPTMMMTINQTIQKMSLKDGSGSYTGAVPVTEEVAMQAEQQVSNSAAGSIEAMEGAGQVLDSAMHFDTVDARRGRPQNSQQAISQCPHPQGKRRRHRRKQQFKRMAVDVQNDKKALHMKTPTSNSSEDSGIGKRKRNIILSGNISSGHSDSTISKTGQNALQSVHPFTAAGGGQPGHLAHCYQQQDWQVEPDSDAVMMDYDDFETNTYTHENGIGRGGFIAEEESGESDTQNDDVESLSDHNQDADDEESDYYNDSSTTSLSESSFTIHNSNTSKKFIPVHSREIRSGRRRLKNTNIPSIENEELSKFLQSPVDSVLKVCPSSEKERQDFKSVASLYSLSYEEGCDKTDQRVWVQFTKTLKTSTQQQRRNDILKGTPSEKSSFNNFGEKLFDKFSPGKEERDNSDEFNDEEHGNRSRMSTSTSVGAHRQLINSKRIKKGC